jgi:predicted ArsR family transcriptional regulator
MNWQLLARANTHPLRVSILEVLSLDGGRTLSPKDLSLELRAPLSTVNYHVTELAKAGLIEMVAQQQVRGAIEHFYRAVDASPKASSRTSRNGSRARRGGTRRTHGRRGGKRTTGLEPATSSLGSSRSTS